ncbi:MAG: NAD-dependent epimerase [Terracidiphilus sp.]
MGNILVTGVAGFIGFHVAGRLSAEGEKVTGVDSLNDYYDVNLKRARLTRLQQSSNFSFIQADISDRVTMRQLFASGSYTSVINLAAQVGVRYSVTNPAAYIDANLVGFANILEGCRHSGVAHLVYASSSSVYGSNTHMPYSVHDNVDHPISLYAATKKSNELMAHSYAHLYELPCTGLRFFTVYGPWGRPDMALWKFTQAILEGKPIDVYNRGNMRRDFTYIDDIVEGVVGTMRNPPKSIPSWDSDHPDPGASRAPYRLYNIGNHTPVELMHVIHLLEQEIGRKAEMSLLPMQPGDVPATYADVDDLKRDIGFSPATPIEVGIHRFVEWYKGYYGKTC